MIEGDITRMLKVISKLNKRIKDIRESNFKQGTSTGEDFVLGIEYAVQVMDEALAVDSVLSDKERKQG